MENEHELGVSSIASEIDKNDPVLDLMDRNSERILSTPILDFNENLLHFQWEQIFPEVKEKGRI